MKLKKCINETTKLKKRKIQLNSASTLPKSGKIDGLELDEVVFSLLDGLVEKNEKTRDTISKTLMKFAIHQPDFILKSILTFLQVQKTSVDHQHSLLCFIKRSLVELKNVPNSVIKEILVFMLKELSFLKNTDLRFVEMREIVNTATVLCPSFSVDVILAFVKDIKQSDDNFEVLCIYIRILTHLCKLVPRNSYVKSILISSHIMSLYNKQIFREQNLDICKELSSLLFSLANMLVENSSYNQVHNSNCAYKTRLSKLISEEDLNNHNSGLYNALDLESGTKTKFKSICKNHFLLNTGESRRLNYKNRLFDGYFIDLINTNFTGSKIRKISRPSMENIKNILEPLYALMLDYYIPKIYINQSYNSICLELLYSLVVISEYVSAECLKRNSLNLLDCIIVRFLQYVPNLQFNDNIWFKLHKINSTNLTNRFVSLFSNPNLINGLPPKYFVVGLRLYFQILNGFNEHNLYINSYNLCNILFSLLLTLYNNTNKYFLKYLKRFISSNDSSLSSESPKDVEFDYEYVDNIFQCVKILFNNSCQIVLMEFLFDKMLSGYKADVIVSMYIFILLYSFNDKVCSNQSNEVNMNVTKFNSYSYNSNINTGNRFSSNKHSSCSNDGSNQIMMYRIINNINVILISNINDNYSLYILTKFVNMLFLSKYMLLYSSFNATFNKQDMEERNKRIFFIFNYIFEYKINIDINYRIGMNMKLYNAKNETNKLDYLFFYSLYQYNTAPKNEMTSNKFVKNDLVNNEQELFDQCIENFIVHSNDYFVLYLFNKLMKNVKRNSFTIFTYFNKIFKSHTKQSIRQILKLDELNCLLILVLIYIHDPIFYFGEALYASKLLFKLYEYVSDKDLSLDNAINESYLIPEGVSLTDLSVYDKLDSFYVSYEPRYAKSDDDYNNGNNENLSFLYPFDIVLHFGNVSKLIKHLNGKFGIDRVGVIKGVSLLMNKLKTRPNLTRNSSFSISTNTFLNTSSTLFGTTQTNTFKVNDIVIDTDLTTYHNLGILNIICIFTNTREGLITNILSNSAFNTLTPKEEMMVFTNNEQLQLEDKELIFWNSSLDVKHKLLMINGINISNVVNSENWNDYLLKLDNILIVNTVKDSSFSLFGKTSSYLQSEKNRLVTVSALTQLYLQLSDYIYDSDVYNKLNDGTNVINQSASDNTENIDGLKLLNRKFNEIVGAINAKRDKLLNVKEGRLSKDVDYKQIGLDEDMVNRYIIGPVINLFNNEDDPNVQEFILNSLLLIINQAYINKHKSHKPLKHENIESKNDPINDVELIGVLFNKLISVIMKAIDENLKMTNEKIEQLFENSEILNLPSLNSSTTDRDNVLPYSCFLVMSSFSPHFRLLRSTNVPYLSMYYILYYSDYYLFTRVSNYDVNFNVSYQFHKSLKTSAYIHFYLTNMYLNFSTNSKVSYDDGNGLSHNTQKTSRMSWDVLYNMVITIMSNNNRNFENVIVKNRLFILVHFFESVLCAENPFKKHGPHPSAQVDGCLDTVDKLSGEDENNWVKIVILVWSYILKMNDNNTKLLLIDVLYRLLNLQNGADGEFVSDTSADSNKALVDTNSGDSAVRLERINKLNSVDSINKLIPERLVHKFILFSINYLEINSYISNSLVKIIHRIVQHNISIISVQSLQSALVVIFKRFHDWFQNNNLPMFLSSFLVDIFKYNINILFNVLFNYNMKFQSSVIFIIIKNDYLLHLFVNHLDLCINNQLKKHFQIDSNVNISKDECLTHSDSNSSEDQVNDNGVVNTELSLEYVLEYNMIIFSNNNMFISCYSDYINALLIYINTMDALNDGFNSLVKNEKEPKKENGKMLKLLEIIYGNAILSRNALLHYTVKIIGSYKSILKSFINYVYTVASLSKQGTNESKANAPNLRDELLNKVLVKILINLIKYKLLEGYDLIVLKIIKSLKCNHELIYYYLKNMSKSGINPYYNIYNAKFTAVAKKRRLFLNKLIVSMMSSFDEKLDRHSFYYYMKLFAAIIDIVTKQKLKAHYKNVEILICVFVKNKTFFVNRRLRHSYLVLYSSILKYLSRRHRNLNKFENLKSYLLYPTSVAMLSVNTNKLEKLSAKCLKLFFKLFFGTSYDLTGVNLCEEIISGLMLKGNTLNRCVCNCNVSVEYGDDLDMEANRLCICNSFQLLHTFSYFLQQVSFGGSDSAENLSLDRERSDENLVVPTNINEEFKSIKRSQLDRKSAKVLFSTTSVEDDQEEEFIDINAYYGFNLTFVSPLARSNTGDDKSEIFRSFSSGSICTDGSTVNKIISHKSYNDADLKNLTVCADVLIPLDVCDYAIKVGTAKSNFMYNSDSLEEYFQNTMNKNNLSLIQLKSLNSISNSFLFLSKNVYRFIAAQKYLQYNLNKIHLPRASTKDLFSLKSNGHETYSQSLLAMKIEDEFVLNTVRLSVFLITRASLYIYNNSNILNQFDKPLEDFEPFGMNKSLCVIRRNYLIHFESLCNVVINKLCKLIDNSTFRLFTYRQLQLLSNISSH